MIVNRLFGTESKKSKFGDFRPELLGNSKRTVCQCVIEHTGHHDFNPAWKETWLSFANEDRLSRDTKLEETKCERLSLSCE